MRKPYWLVLLCLMAASAWGQNLGSNGINNGGASGGTGTVTSVTCGTGLSGGTITTTGTCNEVDAINAQTGTIYPIATTDAAKKVARTNAATCTDTIVAATTAGFGAGFGFVYANNNVIGGVNCTLTPTTSTIGLASSLTIAPQNSCGVTSDGTNYLLSGCTAAINANGINAGTVPAARLPLATSGAVGGIQGDGATVAITAGVLAVNATTIAGQACTPGSTCNINQVWGSRCGTLPVVATPLFCPVTGPGTSNAAVGVETVVFTQNANFTKLECQVTAAPGAGNTHVFQLVINGVNSALTCTIANAATTGTPSGGPVAVADGAQLLLVDTPTGTPAAASGFFGATFQVTN